MPREGFEPSRANAHYPLKIACLPIPPPRHQKQEIYKKNFFTCLEFSFYFFVLFLFFSGATGVLFTFTGFSKITECCVFTFLEES